MREKLTYTSVGVDYGAMDPFKRMCQMAGRQTATNIVSYSDGRFQEFEASRGESAYLIETPDCFLAHVEEGLGTKNLVADAIHEGYWEKFSSRRRYYGAVAQDTVAMIVNDMTTLGARPLSVAMHLAVASSDWFSDAQRVKSLVNGWQHACNLAGCAWGGGETPTLKNVVVPETFVLSGSAIGLIEPKQRIITECIEAGDVIVLIESSGIHANGLTLARKVAERLPEGFMTVMPKMSEDHADWTYGEVLLDATRIYVRLVEECLNRGVDIHYAVNITGHGWRKLMRATRPFTYVIERLPTEKPVFSFIQEHGQIDDREAYGTFNMGAGFALYVPYEQVDLVLDVAAKVKEKAFVAGRIEKGEKKVVIRPKDLEFTADTLAVR